MLFLKSLTDKVTFKQRPYGSKRVNQGDLKSKAQDRYETDECEEQQRAQCGCPRMNDRESSRR